MSEGRVGEISSSVSELDRSKELKEFWYYCRVVTQKERMTLGTYHLYLKNMV